MSNNTEKVYQVRYNTQSTDDSNRWRLLCDGQEILVANKGAESGTLYINTQGLIKITFNHGNLQSRYYVVAKAE